MFEVWSLPVQVVLAVGFKPTTSISSPTLITPISTLPVATVPLPEIEKVSSTGIRKGLSVSLFGVGIAFSTAAIRLKMASLPSFGSPPVAAAKAEPLKCKNVHVNKCDSFESIIQLTWQFRYHHQGIHRSSITLWLPFRLIRSIQDHQPCRPCSRKRPKQEHRLVWPTRCVLWFVA